MTVSNEDINIIKQCIKCVLYCNKKYEPRNNDGAETSEFIDIYIINKLANIINKKIWVYTETINY